MPTAWNMFVKKIYHEGRNKDSNYQFKDALKDASSRKGEMGTSMGKTEKRGKSKSRGKSKKNRGKSKRRR
jgi:hypothetical protein